MKRIILPGIDGSNPLGFLAALGLLRIVPNARLGFAADGSFRAFLDGFDGNESAVSSLVAGDALTSKDPGSSWRFTYTKAATKKQAPQEVADLKPPPKDFKEFLADAVEAWLNGAEEREAYAAAYATDVAVDGKDNTKPTAFHFTAAQQTFLGAVDDIRASINEKWVHTSLFEKPDERKGSNLRWDPGADRNWALMANNPSGDGTRVNAPLEWLAFRGLPLLPSFPVGERIITTGVVVRGDDMTFTWPLWSVPASRLTTRSLLQVDWPEDPRDRAARGVFAVCRSAIRRQNKFGNFAPAAVS